MGETAVNITKRSSGPSSVKSRCDGCGEHFSVTYIVSGKWAAYGHDQIVFCRRCLTDVRDIASQFLALEPKND